MVVDPALMLAQLSQGERLAHEIQIVPALAQAAEHDAVAKQLLEEQQQVQSAEKSEAAGEARRRAESPAGRREGQGRRHRAVLPQARQTPEISLTGAAPSDSEAGEVAGGLFDASV